MKPNKNSLEHELALVSVPEDFPKNLQSLSALDSSLRCPICKDFYSAPVVIHIPRCCHTFCSACIRTCFNNNSNSKIGAAGLGGVGNSQRCPVCKIEAQEEKIKPVPSLESAVASWIEARDQILGLVDQVNALQNQLDRQIRPPAQDDCSAGPSSDKRLKQDSSSHPQHSQNRTDPEPANGALPPDALPTEPRRTRATARTSKENAPDQKPPTSTQPTSSLKRKHQSSSSKLSDSDSDSDIEFLGENPTDPNISVSCPLCGTQLVNSKMDAHVTRCLSGTKPTGTLSFKALSKTSGLSSKAGKIATKAKASTGKQVPEEEKLPLPHFASLKPKELRAELVRHALSADGSKEVQTRRLSRFITLFNANLDADPTRRKSLVALRTELGEWERLQDADAAKRRRLAAQPGFAVEQGLGKRRAVVSSEREYLVRNKDQFAALTLQAARSARAAKEASKLAPAEPAQDKEQPEPDGEAQPAREIKETSVERDLDNQPTEINDRSQPARMVQIAKKLLETIKPGLDKEPTETDGTPSEQHQDASTDTSGQIPKPPVLDCQLDVSEVDVER